MRENRSSCRHTGAEPETRNVTGKYLLPRSRNPRRGALEKARYARKLRPDERTRQSWGRTNRRKDPQKSV